MPRFHIQTFGCKSNQYESQAIREALIAAGFTPAPKAADADIHIINTCGVTGRAGASCRNAIRKTLRAHPDARLVVTGCGVDLNDTYPDMPGRPPLFVPNAKKHALPRLLSLDAAGAADVAAAQDDRFAQGISRFHDHTRAFIKIQDGCDNFCSYCAVPFARGKPESRPPDAILEEAARLVDHGYKELVLTGIHIGAYRHGSHSLADVVADLARVPGLVRLRLGSVEPPQVNRDLVAAMASFSSVCPHIHLPLQSGDDNILAAMGRRYTTGGFLEKTAMLRECLPNPAITTDVIVGFPGETVEAAEASCAFCRRAGFSRLHVFLFSPRPGTRAATLARTASDREIEEWKTRLIDLGNQLAGNYASSCVGMRERVLVERNGSGLTDRYIRARLDSPIAKGSIATVEITGSDGGELLARVSGA
ncbi:MAG: tRNA (N(6)-L-threonylcarbamoyladenosine(37)-C(2))-methylthiotransferase MtaB [Planctomycetota bacterium]|jgi:threonylcarbamoyladenosine tRNA methylthiotransferase MtaB|nr:tRNA (N(6)-L-threonylcarbamoyladenosine(37)-C(2))-methylthiotransferase MtaB [Planctomycetota bacterium]